MNISELIAILEAIKAEHGDLPVYVADPEGDPDIPLSVGSISVEPAQELHLETLPKRVVF